ncbi:MAG: hypothetical protein H6Q58_117 [Firmicutes bacterium]|nr:hypothetical protein [Bacillota bacterium]
MSFKGSIHRLKNLTRTVLRAVGLKKQRIYAKLRISLTEFDKILEVRGIEEHSRLVAMLKDINDKSQDIIDS